MAVLVALGLLRWAVRKGLRGVWRSLRGGGPSPPVQEAPADPTAADEPQEEG